jgi:hypothetical protein
MKSPSPAFSPSWLKCTDRPGLHLSFPAPDVKPPSAPFGHPPLKFANRLSLHLPFPCIRYGVTLSACWVPTPKVCRQAQPSLVFLAHATSSRPQCLSVPPHKVYQLAQPSFAFLAHTTSSRPLCLSVTHGLSLPTGPVFTCHSCAFDMKSPSPAFGPSWLKCTDRPGLHLSFPAPNVEPPLAPFGHPPLKFANRLSLHLSFPCIRYGVTLSAFQFRLNKIYQQALPSRVIPVCSILSSNMWIYVLHSSSWLTCPAFTCPPRVLDIE